MRAAVFVVFFLVFFVAARAAYMRNMVENISQSLPKNPARNYSRRNMSGVDRIVLHHTAGSAELSPADVARIHIGHGWPGIGYHYMIYPDGKIYQCNELETLSFHCSGNNARSVGLCLAGNFEAEKPTEAALKSAAWLVSELKKRLPGVQVYEHRELGATLCPGRNLNKSMIS